MVIITDYRIPQERRNQFVNGYSEEDYKLKRNQSFWHF